MSRFRFSLASLVAVVCVAAIVLGAWRYEERLGVIVLGVLSTFALASATVAGVLGNEATRRRWLPFAIFTAWYALAAWGFWYGRRPSHYVLELLMGPTDSVLKSGAVYAASDFVCCLLFGFIGMIACQFYWKHHPPGGGGEQSKRPDQSV